MVVKDSNGNYLVDGDSVMFIKDLKAKGTSVTLKRGTLIKNMRPIEDEEEIAQCGEGKWTSLEDLFAQEGLSLHENLGNPGPLSACPAVLERLKFYGCPKSAASLASSSPCITVIMLHRIFTRYTVSTK
jgi:protein PhnA